MRKYKYTKRATILTNSELAFYKMLEHKLGKVLTIVPQAHISAFIDHRIPGQEWEHAFKHINGKSVDFLLCSKAGLRPLMAIELDDKSHKLPERVKRDAIVSEILSEAGIRLVRFSEGEWTHPDAIINKMLLELQKSGVFSRR